MSMKPIGAVVASAALAAACVTTTTNVQHPAPAAEQAEANLNLGAAYLRQGRTDLALEKLERALEQDPRLAMAHSTIALVYDQLGDVDQAEQHYRRATQLEPDNPASANSYAVFLCRHDRWRQAEPYFKRAASNPRYPTPAVALTNAGVCARSAGELDKAEQDLRAALAKDPTFADALLNMAELSYQKQNYMQARAFTERYLDGGMPTAGALLLCVEVEEKLGDAQRVEQCALRLKHDFPESPEVAELEQLERNAGQ